MEDAGQKLKRARERLNLRYRDVEQASLRIAERRENDEFAIALSRLSDIENKGTVPTIYRLYSLCAIYRLEMAEVLEWYRVDLSMLPAEAASIQLEQTHLLSLGPGTHGEVQVPLVVDSGVDLRQTTYLSRAIHRWGKLPLSLLNALDLKHHRYAFIGSEDWSMYPIMQPGALVLIDEGRRKIVNSNWSSEFERPVYFSGASRRIRIWLVRTNRWPDDRAAASGLALRSQNLRLPVGNRCDRADFRRGDDPGSGKTAPELVWGRCSTPINAD